MGLCLCTGDCALTHPTCEDVVVGLPPSRRQELREEVALVTGATGGIGEATAAALAALGMRVVVGGRDPQRLADAVRRIRAAAEAAGVECGGVAQLGAGDAVAAGGRVRGLLLDLSSFDAVRAGVAEFLRWGWPLHALVNNAGVMCPGTQRCTGPDGYEQQFATNHLGHFLLTELLLPTLRASAPSRVVCVASKSHWKNALRPGKAGEETFNTPQEWRVVEYQHSIGYANSKACNVMHAAELAAREAGRTAADGRPPVRAVSLHPGTIATDIGRDVGLIGGAFRHCDCLFLSQSQGASTSVWAAVAADDLLARFSGRYLVRPGEDAPTHPVCTMENAALLRDYSLRLVGLPEPPATIHWH